MGTLTLGSASEAGSPARAGATTGSNSAYTSAGDSCAAAAATNSTADDRTLRTTAETIIACHVSQGLAVLTYAGRSSLAGALSCAEVRPLLLHFFAAWGMKMRDLGCCKLRALEWETPGGRVQQQPRRHPGHCFQQPAPREQTAAGDGRQEAGSRRHNRFLRIRQRLHSSVVESRFSVHDFVANELVVANHHDSSQPTSVADITLSAESAKTLQHRHYRTPDMAGGQRNRRKAGTTTTSGFPGVQCCSRSQVPAFLVLVAVATRQLAAPSGS
jgi:hypothetical protein